MYYLLVAVVVAALFFYFGLGLSLLIVPAAWRRYTLLLAPTIGFCLMTMVGWRCYVRDIRGTDIYAPVCLVVATVALAVAVGREWRRGATREPWWSGDFVAPLVVGVFGFLLTSVPLLLSSNDLTSYSFGNSDIADSAAISSYLKHYDRYSQTGFLGQTPILQDLANRAIFGGSLATAVPASLLRLETYQLQTMSVHLFFLFSVLVMYVVARELFRYEHTGATILCALYAVSPLMFWTVCQGYQGQVVTMGVALLLMLVHAQAVRADRLRAIWRYLPLAVTLNWGFNLSYPHMVLFAQAPVLGYACLTCLRTRSPGPMVRYFCLSLVVAAVVYRMSPYRAECLVNYLVYMGGVKAGWFIPWLTPDRYLGLLPYGNLARVLPTGLQVAISLPLLGVCVWGLAQTFRDDRDAFCFATSLLLVVGSGYFLLAIQESEGGRLGGYKSYKFISFFLPAMLLASWTLFRRIPNWRAAVRSPAWLGLIVVLFGANLGSDSILAAREIPNALIVDQNLAEVGKLSQDERVDSLNLLERRYWDVLWLNNFLIDKRLDFLATSYSGREASPLRGNWDLIPRRTFWDQAAFVHWNLASNLGAWVDVAGGMTLNDRYLLARRHRLENAPGESSAWSVQRGGGWIAMDQSSVAFNPFVGRGTLIVRVPANVSARFRALFRRGPTAKRLLISLNGYQLADCGHHEYCWIDNLPLRAGDNVLELTPVVESVTSGDTPQSFTFTALDLFVPELGATTLASRPAGAID